MLIDSLLVKNLLAASGALEVYLQDSCFGQNFCHQFHKPFFESWIQWLNNYAAQAPFQTTSIVVSYSK